MRSTSEIGMQDDEARNPGSDFRVLAVAVTAFCAIGLSIGAGAAWMGGLTDPERGLSRYHPSEMQETRSVASRSTEIWDRLVALGQIEFRFRTDEERRTAEAPAPKAKPRVLEPNRSTEALLARFDAHDYDLDSIMAGRADVPRVFVSALPNDFAYANISEQRKTAFVKSLLPLILKHNEQIAADRDRLEKLITRRDHGHDLRGSDIEWLLALSERYNVDGLNLDELLRRVDIVPPSLALAQAVEESGWGTSRFAHRGNAIFGQYTETPGAGIVPLNRPEGARHEVMRFDHLDASVGSYILNLNRHNAYRDFRDRRNKLRAERAELDGALLANGLNRYSSRGNDYIRTIRSIIRVNGFERFDKVRLREGVTAEAEMPPAEAGSL